jgi:hypothetical protein
MAEIIFCIFNEQRDRIYDDLRGIEDVRTTLSRQGFACEQYASDLKTYTERIVRLLDSLPRDPRCERAIP